MIRVVASLMAVGLLGIACRAEDAPVVPLPLKTILLFNSGVGFFEHHGEIDGKKSVELKFKVDDVNDLLKSLVVQDSGGGKVSNITYGSKDPVTKTLSTFAIHLTSEPTLSDLLRQVRGEVVEIEAPDYLSGTIIGVESRSERVSKNVEDQQLIVTYLTLLTDKGIKSIAIRDIGTIKLANPTLDDELRQALRVSCFRTRE